MKKKKKTMVFGNLILELDTLMEKYNSQKDTKEGPNIHLSLVVS